MNRSRATLMLGGGDAQGVLPWTTLRRIEGMSQRRPCLVEMDPATRQGRIYAAAGDWLHPGRGWFNPYTGAFVRRAHTAGFFNPDVISRRFSSWASAATRFALPTWS